MDLVGGIARNLSLGVHFFKAESREQDGFGELCNLPERVSGDPRP